MTLTGTLTLPDWVGIEADIDNLETGVYGAVLVNMGADNYTLTDAESRASAIILTNVGNGTKTLTWPTTTDGSRPSIQFIYGALTGNKYTVKAEGSATTFTGYTQRSYAVSVTNSLGAIDISLEVSKQPRGQYNNVADSTVASNTFAGTSYGELQILNKATGGAAQTWDIDTTANSNWPENSWFDVHCPAGSDGATITGKVGVTLNPATVNIAAGQKYRFVKDGTSDTWWAF